MTKAEIQSLAEELELEDVLFADGFDDAFIGFCTKFNDWSAAYDYDQCIAILEKRMSHEEAVEYFDFNVAGAYVGKSTPVFVRVAARST